MSDVRIDFVERAQSVRSWFSLCSLHPGRPRPPLAFCDAVDTHDHSKEKKKKKKNKSDDDGDGRGRVRA